MSRNVSTVVLQQLLSSKRAVQVPSPTPGSQPLGAMEPWRRVLTQNMYSWEHLYRLHHAKTVVSETQVLPYNPQQGLRTALSLLFLLVALVLGLLYCRTLKQCRQWRRKKRSLKRTALSQTTIVSPCSQHQHHRGSSQRSRSRSVSRSRSPSIRVNIVYKPRKRSPPRHNYRHSYCTTADMQHHLLHSAPQLCAPESDTSLVQSVSESSFQILVPGAHSADDVLRAHCHKPRSTLPLPLGEGYTRKRSNSGTTTESVPSPWSSCINSPSNSEEELLQGQDSRNQTSPVFSVTPTLILLPDTPTSDQVVTIPITSKVTSL